MTDRWYELTKRIPRPDSLALARPCDSTHYGDGYTVKPINYKTGEIVSGSERDQQIAEQAHAIITSGNASEGISVLQRSPKEFLVRETKSQSPIILSLRVSPSQQN